MREAEGQTTRMGGVMDKAKVAAIGFGVAGVAVVAEGLKKSVEAALDAQKSQARLEVAFRNAHLQARIYEGRIKTVEAASRKLGFTDEDVKNSLGSLITASGNYTEAAKELATAQDLARFKGVSLEQATKGLTMAHAGSMRAIKQLGFNVQSLTDAQEKVKEAYKHHTGAVYENALATAKATDKANTFKSVLQLVTDRVHGQADAYSTTAQGSMAEFHAQMQHIEVTIGTLLIPAMTKMIAALNRVLIWIQANWPQISATVRRVFDQVRPYFDLFIKNTKVWVDLIRSLVHGDWGQVWHDVGQIIRNALTGAIQFLRLEVRVMAIAAAALGNAALDGLRAGLVGIRNVVFSHIINPFTGAIDDGVAAVKRAITGLFGKVIGWVEHVLGRHSPSAVFYGIGQDVVRGFINGVGSMGGILKNAVIGMVKSALPHLKSPFSGDSGSSLKPTSGSMGSGVHASAQQARAFAYSQLGRFGWGSGQYDPLNRLWNQESGWRWNATNSSSGAYGIPQMLPSAHPGVLTDAFRNNAFTQILWGMNYIKGKYGSPAKAWAQDVAGGLKGYAQGGTVPGALGAPQLAVVHGGETITPPGRGGPTIVNHNYFPGYVGDETVVTAAVRDAMEMFQNRNGRPAYGAGF